MFDSCFQIGSLPWWAADETQNCCITISRPQNVDSSESSGFALQHVEDIALLCILD